MLGEDAIKTQLGKVPSIPNKLVPTSSNKLTRCRLAILLLGPTARKPLRDGSTTGRGKIKDVVAHVVQLRACCSSSLTCFSPNFVSPWCDVRFLCPKS
jgi:hypothetical protein